MPLGDEKKKYRTGKSQFKKAKFVILKSNNVLFQRGYVVKTRKEKKDEFAK